MNLGTQKVFVGGREAQVERKEERIRGAKQYEKLINPEEQSLGYQKISFMNRDV